MGTDSQSTLDVLARFQGRDSPPFIETSPYPDLLELILRLLHTRMELGSKNIFYKVRAHRGFTINEIADQQADIGDTSNVWIGEVRGEEIDEDLFFTKLDQKGTASTHRADHLLPWTRALQRRLERAEEIDDVIAARRGGTKTANFLLRQGEGREFLGKAISTCTGHAVSLMLKAMSNTLPTKQILHQGFQRSI